MKKAVGVIIHPFSNFNRSLKIVFILFLLVPILVCSYMLFDMGMQGKTFDEYLNSEIYHVVLFLMSLLYFIWSYLIFQLYTTRNEEEEKKYIGYILWMVFLSQLFIGNIFFIGIIGIVLYTNKIRIKDVFQLAILKRHKLYTFLSFFVFAVEIFSVYILARNM